MILEPSRPTVRSLFVLPAGSGALSTAAASRSRWQRTAFGEDLHIFERPRELCGLLGLVLFAGGVVSLIVIKSVLLICLAKIFHLTGQITPKLIISNNGRFSELNSYLNCYVGDAMRCHSI